MKWEKPVLSILNVNKTKGIASFKALSGMYLDDEEGVTEVDDSNFAPASEFEQASVELDDDSSVSSDS